MSKCSECVYGAIMDNYIFAKAYKGIDGKTIEIDYKNGQSGCRMSDWTEKQEKCLSNNFSEFKSS